MKEIKELYNLIMKSDFGNKLVEISYSDSEIDLKSISTTSKTYLSCKILFDSNHYIVYYSVGYDDINISVSKVEYGIKVRDEIIANLSDILLRLIEFSNFSDKRFDEFEEYSAPSDTIGWRQIFVNELTSRFGDTDNIIDSCGIRLVVCFDEYTDLFSIILKNREFYPRSKVLLLGVVCDNNYNNVLSAIRKEFKNAKSRFYHLESISNMIIWGK